MSPIEVGGQDTWGSLVRRNRQRLRLTQTQLADRIGVVLKTVSRWETQGARPDDYDTADAAIRVLGLQEQRDDALRLAGFGPRANAGETPPDPYAYVKEMGLDPDDRVVRAILNIRGITDDFRMKALRYERQKQLRDEQRRLEELEWLVENARDERRAEGE